MTSDFIFPLDQAWLRRVRGDAPLWRVVIREKWKGFLNPLLSSCITPCVAGTTVDARHHSAYGANIGWFDARGDVTHGAVFGQAYCTGCVWSANCGWIGLGNGPTNGWCYSNASAVDWGVNHDGTGRLSGYAYGANNGAWPDVGQGVLGPSDVSCLTQWVSAVSITTRFYRVQAIIPLMP